MPEQIEQRARFIHRDSNRRHLYITASIWRKPLCDPTFNGHWWYATQAEAQDIPLCGRCLQTLAALNRAAQSDSSNTTKDTP